MLDLMPSFIVLGSLLVTLFFLIKRAPDRKAATIVNCVLMSALCFVGGMLISAMYTRAVGNENSNPMIIAVLVAFGTISAMSIYIKLDNKQKLIKREDNQEQL
ncbi:hypothetical protein [Amphritea balenae]|uniref:Uncharacterized protein n=1 Tax=Amphritea balenae TaxID=452629 RepID=A0A3P1SSP1_9GAMM|nr:hypothetical protein [Amphritea balenae]RRD00070.1 hypothetical protein EHS89_07625 [Amphritea balenae]GGK76325.1 hypothetical protein GCM10007941_28140 [Amphritea balenae]